jgi:hypothetical protein
MNRMRGQFVGNNRAHAFLCVVLEVFRFLVTPLDSDKR